MGKSVQEVILLAHMELDYERFGASEMSLTVISADNPLSKFLLRKKIARIDIGKANAGFVLYDQPKEMTLLYASIMQYLWRSLEKTIDLKSIVGKPIEIKKVIDCVTRLMVDQFWDDDDNLEHSIGIEDVDELRTIVTYLKRTTTYDLDPDDYCLGQLGLTRNDLDNPLALAEVAVVD